MSTPKTILSPIQRLLGEDFNPALLVIMVRKSLVWCMLIMLITISASLIYLRYTPPTYEVNASLIVKPINTAQALDIQNNLFQGKNTNLDIEKDIQIMKSNVIIDRVIDSLNLHLAYYKKGTILNEELYNNNPFIVHLGNNTQKFYDKPIGLRFLPDGKFQLNFSSDASEKWQIFEFNRFYVTPKLQFNITLNPDVALTAGTITSEYFFIVQSPATLYNKLRSALQIAPSVPTIGMVMRDRKPNKAADIVNKVCEVFIKYDKEKKTESATLILQFIEAQVDSISNDLHGYEDQMTQFKLANGIAISSMEQDLNGTLKDLKTKQEDLNTQFSTLEYYRKYFIQYQDSASLLFGIIDPMFNGLSENIQTLDRAQTEFKALSLKLSQNNPQLLNLKDQIDNMKRNILTSIVNNQQKVEDKSRDISNQMSKYLNQFATVPGIQSQYMRISRLSDLKEKYYLLLLDKKSAFDITKAGFVSDYTILRKADVPTTPIFPNTPLIKLLGIALGLFGCFVLIIVRYLLHHKILSIAEITKYCEAGILGVIPKYNQTMDVSQLVVNKSPKSVISECFRSMRMNLDYISPDKSPQLIAVTSTVAGEGKTFIAVNMAGIMAVAGKKVLLLDFDLRKPQLHRAFKVDNHRGVSTLLIGKYTLEECIRHSEWENLDYITSGPLPPNPAEFISLSRTEAFLEDLKTRYDVLVVDTPPVGIVTDALDLIKKADVPIYIVRADYSSRNFLNNINHLVLNHKIKKLSIVLNDMGEGASIYSYNYGYGYSYGYGNSGYGYHQYGYDYYTDDAKESTNMVRKAINIFRSLF